MRKLLTFISLLIILISINKANANTEKLYERLVNDWSMEIRNFWHVVPHEILNTLDNPVSSETVIGKIA